MGAPRFVETTRDKPPASGTDEPVHPVLVIAHHPGLARVGDAHVIADRSELARLSPVFGTGRDGAPIDDPFVSRTPIALRRVGDELEIESPGVELAIGGIAMPRGTRRITAAELARGIDLVLGERVVLWLTTTREYAGVSDELGMVGASRAVHALRLAIRELAGSRGPVLVLGETGTGKELVARAIGACARPDGPFAAVNVAAIPAAVATAELFGHEKGAFTGATERRAGYFERADRGVLFLDEIGDLPDTVQPILLRALESGEIQPVGGTPRIVDTLVVAATDADLAAASDNGRFRAPLYHRLAATTLRVPPLRDRRIDVGILLARFVAAELSHGHAALDRTTDATPWLPASLVAELIRAPWPGNIRQLRAIAHKLAAIARARRTATLAELGIESADVDDDAPVATAPATTAQVDDARLVATLREHRFHLARTAEALGVSRTHLDALIAKSPCVRKAKDLSRDEIAAASASHEGDLDAMAAALEVSPRGLRLRMRQLGL